MTFISGRGVCYEAMWADTRIILWRPATTKQERREWPNGFVFRIVDLPRAERPGLHCTCPAAKYNSRGAMGCPHGFVALVWAARGGQGGGHTPLPDGAVAPVVSAVRHNVTGPSGSADGPAPRSKGVEDVGHASDGEEGP